MHTRTSDDKARTAAVSDVAWFEFVDRSVRVDAEVLFVVELARNQVPHLDLRRVVDNEPASERAFSVHQGYKIAARPGANAGTRNNARENKNEEGTLTRCTKGWSRWRLLV